MVSRLHERIHEGIPEETSKKRRGSSIERTWQPFYQKFLSLIYGLILLLTVFLLNVQFTIFYLASRYSTFYVGYTVSSFILLIITFKYGREYRELKDKLNLYLPNNETPKNILQDMEEPDETSVKACYYYFATHTFEGVSKALGFKFPTQAKREIIKGLNLLLKSYQKHEKEVLNC